MPFIPVYSSERQQKRISFATHRLIFGHIAVRHIRVCVFVYGNKKGTIREVLNALRRYRDNVKSIVFGTNISSSFR